MYRFECRVYETKSQIVVACEYERDEGKSKQRIASTSNTYTLTGSPNSLIHDDIMRLIEGSLSRIAQKLDVPLF